jgi:hypothetical protein
VLDPEGAHCLEDFGEKRCGGVRVHVDMAHGFILLLLPYRLDACAPVGDALTLGLRQAGNIGIC